MEILGQISDLDIISWSRKLTEHPYNGRQRKVLSGSLVYLYPQDEKDIILFVTVAEDWRFRLELRRTTFQQREVQMQRMGLNWLPSVTILIFTLKLCRSQCEDCEINGAYVGCRAMDLTHVPACVPENVIRLDLRNNKIVELTQSSFHSFTAVEALDVSYNIIRMIDEASFRNLQNLKTLVLSGNFISELHDNLFLNNGKLISLSCAYNQLTSLNEFTFQPLAEMESLVLYGNKIQTIPHRDTFSKNLKLSHLDIGWNLLTTLDKLLFSSNRNMEIYLKDNPLHCDCTLYEATRGFKDYNISIRSDAYCVSPPELAGATWNDLGPPAFCNNRRSRQTNN